jgi:hypothetical protein
MSVCLYVYEFLCLYYIFFKSSDLHGEGHQRTKERVSSSEKYLLLRGGVMLFHDRNRVATFPGRPCTRSLWP